MDKIINIDRGEFILDGSAVMDEVDKQVVSLIMKMYSFECFLYRAVNKASRDKDASKIKTLGAFALLLAKTIQRMEPTINVGRDWVFQNKVAGFVTYRGQSMMPELVEEFKRLAPSTDRCSTIRKNI